MSDGLLGDLGHILKASGVGACVDATVATNLLAASAQQAGATADFDAQTLMQCALAGGDDYELVFTAPPAQQAAVQAVHDTIGQLSQRAVTEKGSKNSTVPARLIQARARRWSRP